MPEILIFDHKAENVERDVRIFNLTQAKEHAQTWIDALKGALSPEQEDKLLDKYERLVASALTNHADVPYKFASTKKEIYNSNGRANAAIKRESYKLNEALVAAVRGLSDPYGDPLTINRPFFEKNAEKSFLKTDYYLVDELAENLNRTPEQQYIFKTLLQDDAYLDYELDNPMEQALFSLDKNKVAARMIVMGEYISNKTITNFMYEHKDVKQQIEFLQENKAGVPDIPFAYEHAVDWTNDMDEYNRELERLIDYKAKIENVVVFAKRLQTAQKMIHRDPEFAFQMKGVIADLDFNKNGNNIEQAIPGVGILLSTDHGKMIYSKENKWQIKSNSGELISKKGDLSFNSYFKAANKLKNHALDIAFEKGDLRTIESIVNQPYFSLDRIDNIKLEGLSSDDRLEAVQILSEAASHNDSLARHKEAINDLEDMVLKERKDKGMSM